MGMETHNKYKPTHGGYPVKKIDLHCDDCTIDKMAIRHSEVCKELKQKTEQIQKMEAGELLAFDKFRERIEHLELSLKDREARIIGLETECIGLSNKVVYFSEELSRRKVEIALLEERLNPKPKWAEGVIACEENRPVEVEEENVYWFWLKDKEDNYAGLVYKGSRSRFGAEFVYQPVVKGQLKPRQPKPL